MSMSFIGGRCQEVPDRERGIVFGLDISKDTITYRACRPGRSTKPVTVDQTVAGFRKITKTMNECAEQGYEVWVGYEPTGAYSCCIFEYLEEQGWKVVQINPKHTSKYNDIMDNVPGKSDPRDPAGIAGLVWQGCYRTPLHLRGTYADLRVASAQWQMLTCESTRLRNQLHSMMELWCPELGVVFKNILCMSGRAIVRKYSSVDAIARAGVGRLRKVLHKASRGGTANRAESLIDVCRESKALVSGQETRYKSILQHLDRLEMIEEQKEALKADMEQMLSLLPESRRLLSVRGIGVVICSIILGECGNIGEYNVNQLEKLLGLNLYERSSGKYKGKRKISKCGRAAVRYALCAAATLMTGKYGIYNDVAEEMRAGGKEFGQIRIAVARKLLRLLHSLVKNDEDFDLQRFVARRGMGDDPLALQDRRPSVVA